MRFMRGATVISLVGVFLVVSAGPGHVVSADGSSSTVDSSSTTVSGSTSTTIGGTTTSTIASPTNLDSLPMSGPEWPECASDDVTYCVEPLYLINADGSESLVTTHFPYVSCSQGSQSRPCALDGSANLGVGVRKKGALPSASFTSDDVAKTFHWTIRTGRFSPDLMMLGNTLKTRLTGSTSIGWKLEIWAQPRTMAYTTSACRWASECTDDVVAEVVYYLLDGYIRMFAIGGDYSRIGQSPFVESEQVRDALRGAFISSNGMSQSWDFKADTVRVTIIAPHYLPGKTGITPGFVKVFLPTKYVLGDRGYSSLSEVKPADIALTVSNADSTAKITVMDDGLLIDTGVTHFSAPDPTVRLKRKSESLTGVSTTTTVGSVVTTTTTTATPIPVATTVAALAVLKRGASKALTAIYRAKAAQKARWAASGACSIKGAKLVAKTKTGTCTVTVRVLNAKKKYVVAARKTYSVT